MSDFEDSESEFAKLGREIARVFRQLLRAAPEDQAVAGMSQLAAPDLGGAVVQGSPGQPSLSPVAAAQGGSSEPVSGMQVSQATSLAPPAIDGQGPATLGTQAAPLQPQSVVPTTPTLPASAASSLAPPDLSPAVDRPFSQLPDPLTPSAPSDIRSLPSGARDLPPAPPMAEYPQSPTTGAAVELPKPTSLPPPQLPGFEGHASGSVPIPPVMAPWQDPLRNPTPDDPVGFGKFRKEMDVMREMGSQAHQLASHTDEMTRNMSVRDEQDRQYRDTQYALMLRMIKDQTMDNRRLSEIERRYASSRESIADVNL